MRRTNKPKKLAVSAEVVRRLDDKQLAEVVGGAAGQFCSYQRSGCSTANLTQGCTTMCGGTTIH